MAGGGNELTNIDLVKYILDLLNIDHKNIKFIDDRPGHDFRYSLSFEKSKRLVKPLHDACTFSHHTKKNNTNPKVIFLIL